MVCGDVLGPAAAFFLARDDLLGGRGSIAAEDLGGQITLEAWQVAIVSREPDPGAPVPP
jgi:hypothetical protein